MDRWKCDCTGCARTPQPAPLHCSIHQILHAPPCMRSQGTRLRQVDQPYGTQTGRSTRCLTLSLLLVQYRHRNCMDSCTSAARCWSKAHRSLVKKSQGGGRADAASISLGRKKVISHFNEVLKQNSCLSTPTPLGYPTFRFPTPFQLAPSHLQSRE